MCTASTSLCQRGCRISSCVCCSADTVVIQHRPRTRMLRRFVCHTVGVLVVAELKLWTPVGLSQTPGRWCCCFTMTGSCLAPAAETARLQDVALAQGSHAGNTVCLPLSGCLNSTEEADQRETLEARSIEGLYVPQTADLAKWPSLALVGCLGIWKHGVPTFKVGVCSWRLHREAAAVYFCMCASAWPSRIDTNQRTHRRT